MKKIFIFFLITIGLNSQGQNFDMALQSLAKSAAYKIGQKSNLNLVVYPFYNQKKQHTDLSRLISDDFSVYLAENKQHFKLYDRSYLEQMMQEHQLNEEGLIDPATAKKFGMLIAADAYITGKVMVFPTYIRLHVFAIDTQTGERIYSGFKKIPIDEDIAEFLGIKDLKRRKSKEELYKSSNSDCARENVGDFCFVNHTRNRLSVTINKLSGGQAVYGTQRKLSLEPNEKKCFKNLEKGSWYYSARKSQVFIGDIIPKGEFYVKTCQSDYIILR